MSTVEVRAFRRGDRDQLTDLVNAHVQAVTPGVSVPVNAVLSQIERQPGEFVVDPWVRERTTLVADQRGRISAAAHLVRYGTGREVGPSYRGTAELQWLLHWLDAPFWPDASRAAATLTDAVVAQARDWRAPRLVAEGALPAPGVYGIPEQWPHIRTLLRGAGFTPGEHTETVLLATVDALPRPPAPGGLTVRRTLGVNGTRFTAYRGAIEAGAIEVDAGVVGPTRLASQPGWADLGNLWTANDHRRRGIATWLLGQAADWLTLGGTTRLLAYTEPDEPALHTFLTHAGFAPLTQTSRGWWLDL
ncbi:GNAT family N-acetyltransferase [Streptomyces sp. NPDC050418]|uniref:GNAT family N-acetyltransferase n=1 Tax=Streptomyces sp. NPDC050418 TaxID=3365612 RepID=UPI0037982C09